MLSRRVGHDEPELLELIREVLALTGEGEVRWAVDTNDGGAALLIGLLPDRGQPMVHLTGLAVHRASAGYRGRGKTDAKDARVIADQARMRQRPRTAPARRRSRRRPAHFHRPPPHHVPKCRQTIVCRH